MSAGKVFTAEQVRAFLTDLAALSAKHGIGIQQHYNTTQLVWFPPDAWYSVFYSSWSDTYEGLEFGTMPLTGGFIAGDTA